jgi:hypothetical protein
MKRRRQEIEQLRQEHATAVEKARIWRDRATVAREEGRNADADRCEDKARDWSSRARQIERREKDKE